MIWPILGLELLAAEVRKYGGILRHLGVLLRHTTEIEADKVLLHTRTKLVLSKNQNG